MKSITIYDLTESQEKAFNALASFVEAPITNDINSRVAVLTGKAGTGKTTLIKLILEKYLEEDRERISEDNEFSGYLFGSPNVYGIALAHKAKNVLAKSIHYVNTFAGYFGLKEHYDHSGKLQFAKDAYKQSKSDCKKAHKVAVHDECSMYDDEMLKTVLEDTNKYVKLIFLGDPHQLPPITNEADKDSPTFTKFKNVFHLKERVRQTEGNPIIDLSDVVAEQIFREIKPGEKDDRIAIVLDAIKEPNLIDGKGFMHLRYKDFLEHYKMSSEDYLDSKVIAYRRKKVDDFNNIIRNHLYHNPSSPFIEGEIVYMNETYYADDDTEDKKAKYICYNSDEYKISGIVKGMEIQGVDSTLLYIDSYGHNHLTGVRDPFIPVVSKSGQSEYNKITYFRKQAAIKAEPHKKALRWKHYYDFTNLFGNLSYGYCYTTHKSQGSTFKTVYIDINDILTIGPISTKRKLQAIYTAITRASHLVVFLKSN